ncbi:MAG: pyruvate ferredoxin oxidoreductase, partial [Gammaproteobacteria bacterium]|nr:pyruvate ferredoxin oxidoreductase [Gammaproteobacteria bacterium]
LCEEVCAEEAILFQIQDEATVSSARQAWNTWMMTPDTSSETIDRVFSSDDVDNMAALNLSRHCLLSMSGGDGGEAGSGEKIAMRMVLAATEYQQQPTITAFSEEIASVIEEIRGEIRKVMALEISDEDLNQLEKSVDDVKSPIIELSDLAKSVEASIGVTPVDTARLSSLLDLTRRLADLQTQLTSGRQGLGRSRFGLAIANGNITSWAAVFPYNAFQSPVTVDFSNETSPMAAGLLEGHLRETCEAIALLRLARLEIEQPPGVEFGKAEITQLTWQDLSEEERQICPPLLIVGDDETLGGAGLAQLLWSLSSDLPIKIISFTDLDLGLQSKADRPQDSRTNTGLMAVACQTAYVAQISIARPDHYQQSVTDAIKYSGPAFVRVHTPSPARHGFESYLTLQQAKFSAQSLAFPLFNYNPELPGVHGTRLDISANDSPSDEEDAPFTIAHWAATEARFSSHFKPTSNADDGVELAEYIGLNERGRKGKSAFITIESGEDKIQLDVDEQLINATEAATNAWQVLQELAGVVTPFTEAVEERIRKQVQTEHEAEIATIRAEYEQQLKDQGDGIRSEVAGKVRSQLVRLVSNAPARSEPAD